MKESFENIPVQHLASFSAKDMPVDILRLDLLHPVISGNKWFKLKYYLEDALASGHSTIATFGGAWSNHIVAAAFAAKENGLQSIGFIRGEKPAVLSRTLSDAMSYGMELVFVNRTAYQDKQTLMTNYHRPGIYWINEGGFGEMGSKGAADILHAAATSSYTHILCATGTGTMCSGLIRAALPHQHICGISVLKNHHSLEQEISSLLDESSYTRKFSIMHGYDFGGYAKHPPELMDFMCALWEQESLPTDIVYTSKLLFAAKDLISKKYFTGKARILLIHSGGLQGNASLPPGILPFL